MADTKNTNTPDVDHIVKNVPEPLQALVKAAAKNWQMLAGAVLLVVLVVGGVSMFREYQSQQLVDAQQQLGRIIATSTGTDQVAQLEVFLEKADSGVRPAALLALAAAAMDAKQYAKSTETWAKAVNETSGPMQISARLGLAKTLLLANRPADALTEMKDLADNSPASFAKPVQRELALAAEAAGETDTAIAAYRKLSELGAMDAQFIEYKLHQLEVKK